jgi:hypothetical protein
MPGYSANTCDIITLFPLGAKCSTINSYTPFTNDGGLTLIITGGTPPYTINWSNGSQSQTLYGLSAGEYTATVTDYYKDFTATTKCIVSATTFYLEEFYNCNDVNNKIYYIANLENQTQTGVAFSLNSQLGCWVSNGITLYSGQSYFNYTATTSAGPFSSCTECLPTTPELENTSGLCLTTQVTPISFLTPPQTTVNQYQFYSANTINGYPSWTSNTLTMYYSTGATKWLVSGWTEGGTVSLQSTLSPPIGIWTYNGQGNRFANVTQGQCSTFFVINTSTNSPSCEGISNGKIIVNSVVGGTAPYTYSLNNILYQTSNIFLGLADGTYTLYVKDIIGNISTKIITLTNQNPITNYQVTLNLVPANPPVTNSTISREATYNWEIGITPTLPANKEVNFTIFHTTSVSGGTSSVSSPSFVYINSTGTTGGGQYLTNSTTQTTNNFTNIGCHPNYNTTGITRIYTAKIVGTGKVTGQIFKKVTTPNGNSSCAPFASITDTITVNGVILSNNGSCETVIPPINNLSFTISKQANLIYYGLGGGIGVGNL